MGMYVDCQSVRNNRTSSNRRAYLWYRQGFRAWRTPISNLLLFDHLVLLFISCPLFRDSFKPTTTCIIVAQRNSLGQGHLACCGGVGLAAVIHCPSVPLYVSRHFISMPLVAPALPLDTVKMEDRKRPPPDDHAHSTPRLKRQAVSVNGAPGRTEEDFPKDDELDVCFQGPSALSRRYTESLC